DLEISSRRFKRDPRLRPRKGPARPRMWRSTPFHSRERTLRWGRSLCRIRNRRAGRHPTSAHATWTPPSAIPRKTIHLRTRWRLLRTTPIFSFPSPRRLLRSQRLPRHRSRPRQRPTSANRKRAFRHLRPRQWSFVKSRPRAIGPERNLARTILALRERNTFLHHVGLGVAGTTGAEMIVAAVAV